MSEDSHRPTSSANQVVLHIWPHHASALSIDPESMAALLHLQLSIPGRFAVAYTANPDKSPSGLLPYITHGLHSTSTLPSIVKYVANLAGAHDVDRSLTSAEKAQHCARIAHIQSDYGDLLACMLYSLSSNWWKTTRPALASMLTVPQCYYVPGRIRESFKPRLEAAELWDVPPMDYDEEEDRLASVFRKERKKKTQTKAQKMARAFKRERVAKKAHAFLSLYAKLLGGNRFFNPRGERPDSLDIVFAAYTHILVNLPFSDTLIQQLLSDTYPTLVAHAKTVELFAFPNPDAFPPTARANLPSLIHTLFPRSMSIWPSRGKRSSDKEESRYAVARWGWAGVAVFGVATYWYFFGLGPGIQVVFAERGNEEDGLDEDEEELEDMEDMEDDADDGEEGGGGEV